MLEKVIKLYSTYMMTDVRSPIPHLAGPPGVGKSAVVAQLAELLGVKLHIVNVARLSPLELEGVQMPVGDNTSMHGTYNLRLLTSTLWTQLKEGDIVLLDEFMRGFPEVYNGMLDIMTSREVAGFKLPKVFFIAASNSVAAYDPALEDRLLHLPVPDLRTNRAAQNEAMARIVEELGLYPKLLQGSYEQEFRELLSAEVMPTYAVLDQFKGKASAGSAVFKGKSIRNLIGQAKLREVQSNQLRDLISLNNAIALLDQKPQFVLLMNGKNPNPDYVRLAAKLRENSWDKLTALQQENLTLNLQLIEMEKASTEILNGDEEENDDTL